MFSFNSRNKINNILQRNNRKHVFHNMEDMKEVLILFSYTDWNEIQPIIQDLKSKGKKLTLWTVLHKKHNENNIILPEFVKVITSRDYSHIFGLSGDIINQFKAYKFDTLLDLTTSFEKPIEYLLASNSAEFCIGIKEYEHNFFDLIILKEESKNLVETYDQIKFYLRNIQ